MRDTFPPQKLATCLALVGAVFGIGSRVSRVKRTQIDWLGAALLSTCLAAILLAVTEANDWGLGVGEDDQLPAGGQIANHFADRASEASR